MRKTIKKLLLLASPILSFPILLVPYSLVNKHFIVEWFGCSCPKVDELGNIITPDFNANDFTALFWLVISLCTAGLCAFLSVKVMKGKVVFRVLYVALMLALSLAVSYLFYNMMMWK